MRLQAIVVCVGYADLLSHSLALWHQGLDRLIVISDTKDKATHDLCNAHNVQMHITDIFYSNGARFNKAAAMAEAVLKYNLRAESEWFLTFDADMVPPPNWRDILERADLKCGTLYGAWRYQNPEKVQTPVLLMNRRMPQHWVIGFFSLFHVNDPHLPPVNEPLFDLHWPHAGNYDTAFTNRWPRGDQVILNNLPLIHLGEERANWLGRGRKAELHKRVFSRRPHITIFNHERMANPPQLLVDQPVKNH